MKRRKLIERQPDEGTLEWLITVVGVYGSLIVAAFFALVVLAFLAAGAAVIIRQL